MKIKFRDGYYIIYFKKRFVRIYLRKDDYYLCDYIRNKGMKYTHPKNLRGF